ncbi:flagellin N-terminal helical domain-containing protein [Anaerosporobacter sp.]|uniref:flagellin N-terminal helical domain-containing protein n=1 Tax=Anaerosporobacter sp. TaxID=1872529 RepID=UPI00286ED481|nr:flagellin [Anaerosporobacter sp.]
MRINHNISAIKANMHLNTTNTKMDKSLERLSSGLKINRAADDAAGMAISQKMKTQIAGLEKASNNAADGISVIQTAEGALNEVESMLQRMRELAVQASNGTNTTDDRKAIQKEIDQLNQEIERISDTTEFNTKKLLNGDIDRKSYSSNSKVNLVALSDSVNVGAYEVTVLTLPTQTTATASGAITAGEAGKFCLNGEDVEILDTDTADQIFEKIRDLGDSMNISVEKDAAGIMKFTSKEYGKDCKIEIHCSSTELSGKLGVTGIAATQGDDAKISLDKGFNATATMSASGKDVVITDHSGFSMKIEIDPGAKENDKAKIDVLASGPMILQIGANEGQTMEVRVPEVTPKTLGIDIVNMTTQDGAERAITLLDDAITEVSAIRAKLGAYQNRLEHSIANLDTTGENMTEALSRIEDTDMAEEMAQYTQMQVLSQAGTSMLAQANQRPQTILSLLQG